MLKEQCIFSTSKNSTERNNKNKTGEVLDVISPSNEYVHITMQVKSISSHDYLNLEMRLRSQTVNRTFKKEAMTVGFAKLR